MAYKGRVRPTIALTAADIAADAVGSSEIAAGAVDTAEIATDAVTANEIAAGAVAASEIASTFDISSKTVTLPAASVTAHVTAFDDDAIQNNIAMLAFKLAAGDSLTKFNMVDQAIWNFQDATGIDAANSTNEAHSSTGKYIEGQAAAWETGDRSSTITVTSDTNTFYNPESSRTGAAGVNQQLVNGSTSGDNTTAAIQFWHNQGSTSRDVRFDLGSAKVVTDAKWYQGSTDGHGTWKWQASNDDWTTIVDVGSTFTLGGATEQTYAAQLGSNITAYRYWKYRGTACSMDGGPWLYEIEFKVSAGGADLTLVSVSTTAEATPTTADMVVLIEDAQGTNSITASGDLRFYVSRNGNANWSSALTLVDEGDWGTNKRIVTARNVDISALTGTTDMRWKITTHNQALGSKECRIHAVSLGWS